jgi:hypothetical protein
LEGSRQFLSLCEAFFSFFFVFGFGSGKKEKYTYAPAKPKMVSNNDKASVTKEQNDKHKKVLEALMKLPENRECADCRSK